MTSLLAYTFFVWVELIGFDNAKPDFGVGEYLDRMAELVGVKIGMISIGAKRDQSIVVDLD